MLVIVNMICLNLVNDNPIYNVFFDLFTITRFYKVFKVLLPTCSFRYTEVFSFNQAHKILVFARVREKVEFHVEITV